MKNLLFLLIIVSTSAFGEAPPLYKASPPLVLSNGTFSMPPASGTADGYVNQLTQSFAGSKTFLGAAQFNGAVNGNVNFTGPYFGSSSVGVATSGTFRMLNAQCVTWRNGANDGNLPLCTDSSDYLLFNGVRISDPSGVVPPSAGGTGISNNDAATLARVGNYALTLTLTNTTGVTLPTTGTLATLAGSETLSNKTLTAPVIATIVNSGTLTLPSTTDTLVGRATTDTLTNKTLTSPTVNSGTLNGTYGGTPTFSGAVTSGTSFTAPFFSGSAANTASSGMARLANAQAISWRNAANSGDLPLSVDSSNNLTYNGTIIQSSTGVIPVASGGTGITSYTVGDMIYASGTTTLSKLAIGAANTVQTSSGTAPQWGLIVNANVDASAAIAVSKLAAQTPSRVLVSDGSGFIAPATTTTTQVQLLSSASGSTGTPSTNLVFSTSPSLTTPTIAGAALSGNLTGTPTFTQAITFSAAPVMSALTASQAVVTDGSKNLASLAYASANTASALVQRDGSGNFTAGTITAALTGTASGNTTYTPNQYGVVTSGSGNAMTVIAPDASTTKVLKSGGASASPSWLAYDNANTVSTLVFRDSSGNFSAGTVGLTALNVASPVTPTGTLAPTANISVLSNSATTFGLGVYGNTAGGTIAVAGATSTSRLRAYRPGTSLTSPAASSGTTAILTLEGYGYDGTTYAQGPTIQMRSNGTWDGTSHPSDMLFSVVPSGSTSVTTALTLATDSTATFAGNVVFSGRGTFGTNAADTILNFSSGSVSGVAGTSQYGLAMVPSFVSSTATAEFNYLYVLPRSTSNTGTTSRVHGLFIDTASKGGTDTWTRLVNLRLATPTAGGTGNASIADNIAFTGNYFINSTSTAASLFSGIVTFAGGTSSSSSTTGQVVVTGGLGVSETSNFGNGLNVTNIFNVGTTSQIFSTNEQARFKRTGASGAATQSTGAVAMQLTEAHDTAITNTHRAIVGNYSRTITTNTTDTGLQGVMWSRPDFATGSGTLTNSNATMGYATYMAAAPSLSGTGLAFSHFSGFYVEATSTVTGAAGSKYGMLIGAQTGANSANYGLYLGGASGATTNAALFVNSGNVVMAGAALATNATTGFLYVPTSPGTPTGVPTTFTGAAPIVVDTTNNKLYFYSGGAWRDAGP